MDRLRQALAAYWIPISALIVGIPGLLSGLKQYGFHVPGPEHQATRFVLIGLTVLVLVLVRFLRAANATTRLLLPPQKPASGDDKDRIFIGPRAFTSEDTERFFGRKREADDCWREIQSHSFFILEGESGCGKSSLMNAGVLPKAHEKFRVIVCRVADDPFGKVSAALREEPYRVSAAPVGEPALAEALAVATASRSTEGGEASPPKPLLLCLDQFEELFVTVRDEVRQQFDLHPILFTAG